MGRIFRRPAAVSREILGTSRICTFLLSIIVWSRNWANDPCLGCFKRGKNFKWLKFIPPTANSCYLGQNISWGQKIFQKFWFLDIPMSCQSFLKNHLVKWPFSVAIWSGKKKFNSLQLFCFKSCFCFLSISFVLKMWSFEICYVDVM